jgi:hypothetical protein
MHIFTEEDGEPFVCARILVSHTACRFDRPEKLMVASAIAA